MFLFFFFNDTATTEIYTLSLHDALPSIELPGNGNKLPDQHAKQLFEASSTLTPFMVARATELGMPAEENSRGFIFNAQPLHVIHFLDIGTRPANVHLR